jgi:hypothetical protein
MIPQLTSALSNGFTTKQILDYIIKKFPQHSDKIKSALAAGFSVDQVIKFLSGGNKTLNEENGSHTEFEQMRKGDIQKRENINKAGLIAGGLGASALSAPMVAQALKRALPQNVLGAIPQAFQSEPAISQETIENQTQQPPVNPSNIPQQKASIQPEVKSINVGQLLEKSGLKKHVDNLANRIKDPKQIAGVLYSRFPNEMKQFQEESGKNMEDAIGDYLSGNPEQSGAIPGKSGKNPIISEELGENSLQSPEISDEIPTKISKSSIVATPNGVGEVREIRKGEALVNVNGKMHKVKEEELIESPLPEKELADLYDDLISKIEKEGEQEISKNVYWAGYDPKTNELAYLPHDGSLYVYENISPEDAKELTNILVQRKTSGQNYIGVWKKNTSSPIGAQMSKLIRRLQSERGGKGNEYSNKFQKVYDALEIAKSAAKKQYEERKKKAKKPAID